jgi:integrase
VVDRAALEMRSTGNRTGGSNPSLSATTEITLGIAGDERHGFMSLAAAREAVGPHRKALADGKDPVEVMKAAQKADEAARTIFADYVKDYLDTHRAGWTNSKHVAQWEMTLGNAYCKALQNKRIADIGVDDILGVLTPVWQAKPETARRVRMRLEKVLDSARVKGLTTGENPARWRGHLDHLLPKHGKHTKSHHRALHFGRVPTFLAELKTRPAMAARAFEFLVLTACRTSEVLNAEWSEIDLGAKTWVIPADRMKSRRPHRVPLSDGALAVLAAVEDAHDKFVFPGPRGKGPLSNMALLTLLERMNWDKQTTAHGFRSSFRDWVAETTSYPGEVADMALAHVIENQTESAYRRGDLYEKRAKLMNLWSAFVTGGEKVIQLRVAE